jgi:diguanylate cyclase (GGDEF)-like protein/PAS domain S-box-containing protein
MLCTVLATGEPILISELSENQVGLAADLAGEAALRSAFAFPLKSEVGVVGIFQFFRREAQEADAELLNACRFVAGLVGQFLQRHQTEQELRESNAFARELADVSADWYWEHDAESRVTFLSPSISDAIGVDPQSVIGKARESLRGTKPLNCTWEEYNAIIAARKPYRELEYRRINDRGEHVYYTVSGVPVFDAQGEFCGYRGVGRSITARRRAEFASQRIGRMFATLSATNEANTRAKSPAELYQQLCDVAVQRGQFKLAAVLIADDTAKHATVAAVSGETAEKIQALNVSLDAGEALGRGLVGTAFRTRRACISNDFMSDERVRPWHTQMHEMGVAAGAALPLMRGGCPVGALVFYHEEQGAFDDEIVGLLERMSANVSFALDNMDREAERVHAERALRESEARFRDLTALSSDWYWEQDGEFRFTFLSSETADQGDHGSISSLGKRPWELPEVTPESGSWDEHRAILNAREPFRDFAVTRIKAATTLHYALSGAPMFDDKGRFKGYRGVGRDVTERRAAEERVRYLATHDGLTGLPNRVMFSQLLNLAIEGARRYKRKLAVLFIDLDRFKYVNDSLGHEAGDELLKQMSKYFKECLRASDVVARLGGDEFVMFLEVKGHQDAATAARKVLSAAMKPLQIFGQECRVTASIGVCLYPADASDERSLMKNADLAMYKAKEEGKNNYQFYSKDSVSKALQKISIETQLRDAIAQNEFSMHYQAKRNLQTGLITGVEALMRWRNAVLGVVTPTQFIPVAEETGLIVPIGRWALFTACAQSVAWQKAGLPAICVAVNLSPHQFFDPGLLPDIARALESTGLAAELLELEITENILFHDTKQVIKRLRAIKKLGVRLAIDDFGTGYSSLAKLKQFPIDTLKVDRSFIREISKDVENRAITEAIIAMGKTLSMTVIAEGVETKEQEEFLRRHACDQMQGFYFSKPLLPKKFAALLATYLPVNRSQP